MTTEIISVEAKAKVLEPDAILPPAFRLTSMNQIHFRNYHPSPAMRALGYTRNPDTCYHERKLYSPREGWSCKDCGDRL